MERFGFLLQFGRDLTGDILSTDRVILPDNRLHLDEIDYTFELVFLADGNLDWDGLGVKALTDGIDRMLKISAHLVDLVNETDTRDTVLVSLAPDFFRLRLHPVNRVEHGNRAIENT